MGREDLAGLEVYDRDLRLADDGEDPSPGMGRPDRHPPVALRASPAVHSSGHAGGCAFAAGSPCCTEMSVRRPDHAVSPSRAEPLLRIATSADADAIDALMKAAIRSIFPAFYDARQTASSETYIGNADRMLLEDGTYFVLEAAGEMVACGGWSRRDKLFSGSTEQEGRARPLDPAHEPARVRAMFVRGDWTRRGLGTRILDACREAAQAEGFRSLALMATLPGFQLYERYGFVAGDRVAVTLPDGIVVPCVAMEMAIT